MDFDFSLSAPQPPSLLESHQLIKQLWSCCQTQNKSIIELTGKLNANSRNSSRPPSSDSLHARAKRQPIPKDDWHKRTPAYWQRRRPGAQTGHVGYGRALWPEALVDTFIPCYPPATCQCCDNAITQLKLRRRKQVFDIQLGRLQVTEYQIYSGKCRRCRQAVRGELPLGVPSGILAANALSHIGALTGKFRLSKREVRELLIDFFGLSVSVGTISNAEGLISQALEKPVEAVGQAIQQQGCVHADETSYFHHWQLHWLWVATTDKLTYFKLFEHRNQTCAKALLGEHFSGILVTDRYGAYNWLSASQRQYCWAHLKRDFKKIAECEDPKTGYLGTVLLGHCTALFQYWHSIQHGAGPSYYGLFFQRIVKRFWQTLKQGQHLEPSQPSRFCDKLISQWPSLWHFIRHREVAPTNNQAERQLRHGVLWRKKCFGTQSERGKRFTEHILTSVMTCRQQERKVMPFIRDCMNAYWRKSDYPSLVNHSLVGG